MTLTGIARSTRSAPGLVVSTSAEATATVVALEGAADLAALSLLVDVLAGIIADRRGPVIVDLANIDFIDNATARAIGLAAECLRDEGRSLTFRSPSTLAVMLLETVGLADLVEPDEWAAR
jgi:anti-anti-sigma regulatory factor